MNLVCITCPKGCLLTVEKINDEIIVSGNTCSRGVEYGKSEMLNPTRTLTTTIPINDRRLPVISSKPIPKEDIFRVLKEIKKVKVNTPIKMNDVIIKDVLGLGVDIIASKTILK